MRFLLGVLLGYSMRGKKKPLITVLTTIAFIVYVAAPTIALLALRLDVQRERRMRPTQVQVPALKGLSYENAQTKLHASELNIRLLATRCDVSIQPGRVIDQTPHPGEEVLAVTLFVLPLLGRIAIATAFDDKALRSPERQNAGAVRFRCPKSLRPQFGNSQFSR